MALFLPLLDHTTTHVSCHVRDTKSSAGWAVTGNGAVKDIRKKAIHFGGGNIGRGFVGQLLCQSGYEVVFVDVTDDLVSKLQTTPFYTVTELGTHGEHVEIVSNYRALNSKTYEPQVVNEIATADIVTCAVSPNVLKFIGPVIAKGINARKGDRPIAVIACENMLGGTDKLREFIEPKLNDDLKKDVKLRARFANCAIDRIVPQQCPDSGLNVTLESFFEWCVEEMPFQDVKGGHPNIEGVHWVKDLKPYIERKLFTVNTAHITAATYGYHLGLRTIDQAMANAEVRSAVEKALEETAQLIVKKHNIPKKSQEEYVQCILTRISNPHLKDSVERVARTPIRKLGRNERLVGPAAELADMGQKVDGLLKAMEMCFRFQDVEGDEESSELGRFMRENEAEEVVEKICGLRAEDMLFEMVVEVVRKVQDVS